MFLSAPTLNVYLVTTRRTSPLLKATTTPPTATSQAGVSHRPSPEPSPQPVSTTHTHPRSGSSCRIAVCSTHQSVTSNRRRRKRPRIPVGTCGGSGRRARGKWRRWFQNTVTTPRTETSFGHLRKARLVRQDMAATLVLIPQELVRSHFIFLTK